MTDPLGGFVQERWATDDIAWFEYHCNESHDSDHAEWWYRSHQQVTVVAGPHFDGEPADDAFTYSERAESGDPNTYEVRFADGVVRTVFEDELLASRDGFFRPDPPTGREV